MKMTKKTKKTITPHEHNLVAAGEKIVMPTALGRLEILKYCAVKKQEYSLILEVNERISARNLQTTYS